MILFNSVSNKLSNHHLTTKIGYREAQVLEVLLNHSPDVVQKSDIIQHAWGNQYIGDTSLAKSISALRLALIKLGTKDSPIVTVPKVGYRLVTNAIRYDTPPSQDHHADLPPRAKSVRTNKSRINVCRYRANKCYITTLCFLFAAGLLALSKYYGWNWNELNSNHLLTSQKVGNIEIIYAQHTQLDPQLLQLLSQYQCHCVAYLEQGDQYTELSLMDKDKRRSINISYSHGQLNLLSKHVAAFIKENQS
ncbi:hypothetical protein GCM10007938_27120 [Vibrio zhanjiangensis]|uniref:OmpR/PhoB-type domain-containing protein n=1 Tax=Vibrio zhanjiangensis TaxID=1046128 RepID=A0ABQ6F242_9VIBR|nr:winged helix-turn-helix domain-containing protein [Vibrio zhanjiangensis]GLT18930.1 hypothetical protein GCM10007938_27120 [Vibrio zhanjiangensis]